MWRKAGRGFRLSRLFRGRGLEPNAGPGRAAREASAEADVIASGFFGSTMEAARGGLAEVRAYRRQVPPEPPRTPHRKPGTPPGAAAAPMAGHSLSGVPVDWCNGVARMATMTAPNTITPARWAVLAATSARLLRDHGAALHGARWDAVAVFGLHPTAPMTHPPGWGLVWLLGEHGEVLDVAPDAVGMRDSVSV